MKIYNAKIIFSDSILENGIIEIENGMITNIRSIDNGIYSKFDIDAKGNYVSAGFIDIHVHGGGGCDFMDATANAFLTVAQTHAKFGTTAMVPTTLSSSLDELLKTIKAFDEAKSKNSTGSIFLGLHLEGPYFSFEQSGAQDPKYIKKPTQREYEKILEVAPQIVRWSAAPELLGIQEFANYVKSKGVMLSIAHTSALYDDIVNAINIGFCHVTHLYSCMLGVTRINAKRYGGTVEAAIYEDALTVEIIADGIHLPVELLKYVYKFKGADKIALITDAMRAAGTNDKESILGSLKNGQKVIIEDDVAKLPNKTAFAGSVATANRLVKNMIKLANVPIVDAVKMMTNTPAKIMGVEHIMGSIEIGKMANIVVFDDDINIEMTMIKGEIVYEL